MLEHSSTQGDLTKSRVYDAYGSVRAEDANYSKSGHRYVGALGHPSEGETGLIYMRARYMDPSTGRFISEDPGRHHGNWFVYTSNNPIGRVDPNGKEDLASITATMGGMVMLATMGISELSGEVFGPVSEEITIWIDQITALEPGAGNIDKSALGQMFEEIAARYGADGVRVMGECMEQNGQGDKFFQNLAKELGDPELYSRDSTVSMVRWMTDTGD